MSKYQLSDLLNEISGTGRIGTYLATYRELVNVADQAKEDGIRVKELGMSGDSKVPFEFEFYPENSDPFTVYPYKFDPQDEDPMQEVPFSIGGKPSAMRAAKEILGKGAYSNKEYEEGVKYLDDSGDKVTGRLRGKDIDETEDKKEIKEEEGFTEVSEKEVRFHLDAYRAGTIDGDDLAQAIEEIVFGEIKAPGMNSDADFEREKRMQMGMREEDSVNEEMAPTGIGISQKQLDDLKKLGAISGLEVTVQDKDGSNVRKVDYTLTNTDFEKDEDDIDFVNEDLQNHFGRFMKDYQ